MQSHSEPVDEDAEEDIIVLNYSVHYREWWKRVKVRANPDAHFGYDLAARLLARAQHFLLPVNGWVLDTHGALYGKYAPLLHLPFPITAFEFPVRRIVGINRAQGPGEIPSAKRIALCADHKVCKQFNIAQIAQDEWVCISIYYVEDAKMWMVYPVVNVVSRSRTIIVRESLREDSSELKQSLCAVGLGYEHARLPSLGEDWLDIRRERLAGADYVPEMVAYSDTRDELSAAVQALASLNCANVRTRLIAPSAALARKRQASGKLPLHSYHVLDLSEDENRVRIDGGGTHASPRRHLRRGHIRWLSQERSVFVRSCTVGNPVRGQVMKDYKL